MSPSGEAVSRRPLGKLAFIYIYISFGFVGKHKCFESAVSSYAKPVEGMQRWGGVEKLGKVEDDS